MVAGGEYRYSKASLQVDDAQRTGNIFGFNAVQDQDGSLDVFEGYTEVSLPIVKDQPFMYYLGVEGGYRLSDYSTAGVVHTYKYGGEYSPFEWLKFRGVYNKATRVPSVFETFQNGDQGFGDYVDPCNDADADGAPDSGLTALQCNAITLGNWAPGFFQNNTQVEQFAFGNPNLSPETSETTTMGIVLQTGNDWFGIGNLRASVDKSEIDIADVISSTGAQFYIDDCEINGNAASCLRVFRDPVTGDIDKVNTSRGNLESWSTSGIDIQVDYRIDLDEIGLAGVLSINELYSIIDSYEQNGVEYTGYNFTSIGGAIFDWKSVLSTTYSLDEWTVFARWSYMPELIGASFGETTPAASYVDMAVRYQPADWLDVTLSVSNVADDEAPQIATGILSQGNTDPQVYDVTGRSWSLAIKTKM